MTRRRHTLVLAAASLTALAAAGAAQALTVGDAIPVPAKFALGVAVTDDAVWTTDGTGTVSRIDPTARTVTTSIPVTDAAIALAAGGSVWVIGSNSRASRIDPRTNAVVSSVPVARDPTGVGVGLGSLWVAGRNSQTITRISLGTGKVTARLRTPDIGRYVAVAGGSLWVAANDTPTLWQLTPTGRLLKSIDLTDTPNGIVVTGHTLWIAGSTNNRIVRIDTVRRKVVGYTPIPKSDGFFGYGGAIAAGASGVWVATLTHLLQLSPSTGKIVAATAVGRHPSHDPAGLSAVAVGRGGVWVGDADGKAVVPVTP